MSSRIEQSRKSVVLAAADVLEGIAKAKDLRQRYAPPPKQGPVEGQGDLLFDFVRLQVDYLTRLGELGRAHRDYAFRTLELFYRGVAPNTSSGANAFQLELNADKWECDFVVENCSSKYDPLLSIGLSGLRGPAGPQLQCPYDLVRVEDGRVLDNGTLQLPFQTKQTLRLRLALAQLPPGVIYSGEVTLALGNKTRSLALRVDLRTAAQVDADSRTVGL